MTKLNKRIIFGGVAVVALGLIYLGYTYFYLPSQQEQGVSEQVHADAKREVEGLNLTGDQELSIAYVALLKAGKFEDAKKLFADKVAAVSDISAKQQLLSQQQGLAQANDAKDQAIGAAFTANDLGSTARTLRNIASLYAAQEDYAKAIDYQNQAIAKLQGEPDSASKAGDIDMYEKMLNLYKERQANPIKVNTGEAEGYAA
jgi:tetratricopeptide (TPR) repeat protein